MDNFRGADGDPGIFSDMALEDLAGYSLRRGLGSGSVGTVWLLRDLTSGRHAVLKRVPKSSIPSVEAFTEDVALAQSLDHPHIARLLEVRESADEWLLISQYVAAGTLAALLERRGPLSVGELVTLLSPLAQGLATMHRAGLVHGHLGIRDVMFDADGRPVITDAGLRLQKYPGSPAADLSALATIAHQAGAPPTLFPDTLFTNTPDHLSHHLLQLAPPTPIALGQSTTPTHQPEAHADRPSTTHQASTNAPKSNPPTTDASVGRLSLSRGKSTRRSSGLLHRDRLKRTTTKRSTHRRTHDRTPGKRRLPYGVLVLSGVVAVSSLIVGLLTAMEKPATGSTTASDRPTSRQTPTTRAAPKPSPSPTAKPPKANDWLQTLQALDFQRARAFSTLNRSDLDKIYLPGSAPWTADRTLLASYQRQRIRIQGLRMQIESLTIEHPGDQTVVLRIVDRLIAGTAITATGERTPFPPGPPTTRRITLKSTNTSWRIAAITPA